MKESKFESQEFNGKIYYLYTGEKYFSKHNTRLHVVTWEFFNNKKVPKGYHVHHIDGNTHNNNIDNLELILGSEHNRNHAKKRAKDNPEWIKSFQKKGIEASKAWHASPEGIEQHRKQALDAGFGNMTYGDGECEECGEKFIKKKKSTHTLCSNKCNSRKRRRLGIDNVTKKCCICESDFVDNKYSKTKTCSKECMKIARRKTFKEIHNK